MDEDSFRYFQAIMHVVTAIGAVIVFFVGLDRYHSEQADLIRTRIEAERQVRDREFRRELWVRQLDMLSKIADTASRVAVTLTDSEPTAFNTAVREYELIYWGNVTFIDDTELVRAMDALRHEIRYFRQGLEPIDGLSARDKLKQRAYSVAIACRRTIRESGKDYAQPVGAEKQ